jgi:hypothetical protein
MNILIPFRIEKVAQTLTKVSTLAFGLGFKLYMLISYVQIMFL